MGNSCFCPDKPFGEIKNKQQFLKALFEYLNQAQDQLGSYTKKQKDKKDNQKYNIVELSFEQYQYYIKLNNVLIKTKMIMEDYLSVCERIGEIENRNSDDENIDEDEDEDENKDKENKKKDNNTPKEDEKREEIYDNSISFTPGDKLNFKDKVFCLEGGINLLNDLKKTEESCNFEKLDNIEKELFERLFKLKKDK